MTVAHVARRSSAPDTPPTPSSTSAAAPVRPAPRGPCLAGDGSTVVGLDAASLGPRRSAGDVSGLSAASGRRAAVRAPAAPATHLSWPQNGGAAAAGHRRPFVLSYLANELDRRPRARLLPTLLAAAAAGTRVLVMEPMSRKTSPWWPRWTARVRRRRRTRRRMARWPDAAAQITRALGRPRARVPLEATGRTLWLWPAAERATGTTRGPAKRSRIAAPNVEAMRRIPARARMQAVFADVGSHRDRTGSCHRQTPP